MIRDRSLRAREKLCQQAAGHRRIAAWLAAGAHRPTYQRLPEMRAWRRAPGVCSDGHLCWWTHAATQRASRARRRGSQLAEQLSEAEAIDRDHLRTQS